VNEDMTQRGLAGLALPHPITLRCGISVVALRQRRWQNTKTNSVGVYPI